MFSFIRRGAPPLNISVNFRARYSTSPTDPSVWNFDGSLMYYQSPNAPNSDKIACFGWNKCLVTTSLYMRGDDSWKLRYVNVPEKLKELHDKGYKLVVFCNQSYIGQATTDEIRNRAITNQTARMGKFLELIGLPFNMLVSTAKTPRRKGAEIEDPFRKPNPGMWTYLVNNLNGGVAPDMDSCFYVGGAAGRPKEGPRRADHNDYDLGFAQNAKLKFHTDDGYFGLEKKEKGPSKGKKHEEESDEQPKRRGRKKQDEDENENEMEDDGLHGFDEADVDTEGDKSKSKKLLKPKRRPNEMFDDDDVETEGDRSKKLSKSKKKPNEMFDEDEDDFDDDFDFEDDAKLKSKKKPLPKSGKKKSDEMFDDDDDFDDFDDDYDEADTKSKKPSKKFLKKKHRRSESEL